jgi:hypothetical protein
MQQFSAKFDKDGQPVEIRSQRGTRESIARSWRLECPEVILATDSKTPSAELESPGDAALREAEE